MNHPYRAWAEVDLNALAANLQTIQKIAGPDVKLMMVVKADAYGHGAVAVAHQAVRCGVSSLGVGDSQEALELRAAGVQAPLLVLGRVIDSEIPDLLANRVEIVVHTVQRIRSLDREAARRGTRADIHLNVDTGMGRLGIFPEKVAAALREIPRMKNLRLVGLMTHLSSSRGMLDPFTGEQMRKFQVALDAAKNLQVDIPLVHIANSAAVFTGMRPLHQMVRAGIAAYGMLPRNLQKEHKLNPVLSLRAQIVFLKDHPRDSSIGYNRRYQTVRQTRIATIPLGYNDGVPYRLGNRGMAIVRGKLAPIVGSISMDYTTIDIGKIPGVRVGDTVTLIGRDGDEEITAEHIAGSLETIPYEITCAIGKRVHREYTQLWNPSREGKPSLVQS